MTLSEIGFGSVVAGLPLVISGTITGNKNLSAAGITLIAAPVAYVATVFTVAAIKDKKKASISSENEEIEA